MATSPVFARKLLDLARLTAGRRIWALQQMRQVAESRGISLLIGRIDEAIAHDRYTVSLDSRLGSTPRNRLYSPRVTELRRLSNRTLTGIRDIALGHAKGRAADDSRTVMVKQFLREAFPGGVGAITSLPYADQVAALEDILEGLHGQLVPAVAALGLSAQVEHLAELTGAFRTAIN